MAAHVKMMEGRTLLDRLRMVIPHSGEEQDKRVEDGSEPIDLGSVTRCGLLAE